MVVDLRGFLNKALVPAAVLFVVGVFADAAAVDATHYRGGTISWKPSSDYSTSNRKVEFTYRLAWTRSHTKCDQETVDNRGLIGDKDLTWMCLSGCSGPVSRSRVHCTNFSEPHDWSTGENTFEHVFQDDRLFEISYMHCCWAETNNTNANTEWAMTTKVLLGNRSDTGTVNSAPIVHSPLTIRIDSGVPSTIQLNINDPDGDNVTCRLGREFAECGHACDLPKDFQLDHVNCRLTYTPSENVTGNAAVSLLVEDYHQDGSISVGLSRVPRISPLSSTPFQFIVQIGDPAPKAKDCSQGLPDLKLGANKNHVTVVKVGRRFTMDVSASPCDSRTRISGFSINGPNGTALGDFVTVGGGAMRTQLSWLPREGQEGRFNVCVSAQAVTKLSRTYRISDEVCVTVLVEPAVAYCRGSGGMHFITFDGLRYTFNGGCRYQLALTTFDPLSSVGQQLQSFNITVLNDFSLGSDGRPHVRSIRITIATKTIELRRNKRIMVDGTRVHAPVRFRGFNVDLSGKYVLLTADSGLSVRYDGMSGFMIGLPTQYTDHVKGLCGNMNGNQSDDMQRKPDDSLSAQQFGNSFQVGSFGCIPPPLRDQALCSSGERAFHSLACSTITRNPGCFEPCHTVIDPKPFFDNCLTAMCGTVFSISTLETQVGAYADACQIEGATFCDWRSAIGSALECAPNSHYNACGPVEPLTCSNLNSPRPTIQSCQEGCTCNEGYVLSGENCVPQSRCGCFLQGSYRLPGFQYRSDDCHFECTCVGRNQTSCVAVPPCDGGERCGPHTDGFMRCVERLPAPATCKVIGDPHYKTFDGATYDSMSTCAHIIVKSKEGASVVPFTVVGLNAQPRPNNSVSHVAEVHINVGGNNSMRITLTQGPVIKYNGDVVFPGTSFPGVTFRRSAHFTIVSFDFGLVIRWDGEDRLRLSAWSTLKNQVEGLCGNYDGDAGNDMQGANGGGLITDVDRFVNSWRVTGLDIDGNYYPEPPRNSTERCVRHGFHGSLLQNCISFSNDQTEHTCRDRRVGVIAAPCDNEAASEAHRRSCYILIDAEGPFAPCHSVFNPFKAYEDCLFDLCAYDGNQTLRERILSSYDYDCREKKVDVGAWRESADLPLICGVNSVFTECMPQCQPSCSDMDGSSCSGDPDLGTQCVEGCQCMEGFVVSETGSCVPRESCGCVVNGRYQLQGFKYRQNNCTEECVCLKENTLQCLSVPTCKIGLKCEADSAGYQRCEGRLRRRATCKAVTDPHYKTFDNVYYDSMGTCAYIMVQNRAGTPAPQFRVVAVNENPLPGYPVSHVKEVHVHFGKNNTMIFKQGPIVELNGQRIEPGTELLGFVVRQAGNFIVVDFDFRIVIRWDGKDRLRVVAWQPLRNMVEGLCGDFDDVSSNDLRTSWGDTTDDVSTFVRSWEIDGYNTSGCVLPPPANASDLCADESAVAQYGKECSGLTDPNGQFAACHSRVSPWNAFRDCVYDLCAYNGSTEYRRQNFEDYSADCREAGIKLPEKWRDVVNITVECGPNQQPGASECPHSCTDPDGSKCRASNNTDDTGSLLVEGCICQEGYVLSGQVCVLRSECGCTIDGQYHMKGFVYRSRDCQTECKCSGNNTLNCIPAPPCPTRSKCKRDQDGFKRCVHRLRRRRTCKAVTDPHYMTFDGTTYDSMGMCSYIMVRNKANSSVSDFMVVAVNEQPEPRRIVSHVKEVFVHFGDAQTMRFMAGPVVQLNGVTVNPGFKRDGIAIRKAGRFTVVDWDFGLMVRWDGEDRLRISAWSPLRYQVEGLCGNFDDNPTNDLTAPNGTIISDIDKFVDSWIIEGYGAEGCPGDLKSDRIPPKCIDPAELAKHNSSCYFIIDPQGPFRACQGMAEAQSAFKACVYDQCAYDGDPKQKDRVSASYLATCLDEDEEVNDGNQTLTPPEGWRQQGNLTEPICPPHSHFVACLPQCQPSCDDPDASLCLADPLITKECTEGCKADEGFVLSGAEFVTRRHCGCMYDGMYYLDGQVFMADNCQSRCTCREASVSCVAEGCATDRQCRPNRNGRLACLPLKKETCKIWGNGHVTTFDRQSYDLLTPCSYVVASSRNASHPGGVFMETERNDNDSVTTIRSVSVRFGGFEGPVELINTGSGVEIWVNGVSYARKWKSVNSQGGRMVARHRGHVVVVVSSKGHRVEFDGTQLVVKLPVTYFNVIHGLCGNFNSKPGDDLKVKDGNVTDDVELFAASFRTRSCDAVRIPIPSVCTDQQLNNWRQSDSCGVISDINGPISTCNKVLRGSTTRRYERQCIQDLCETNGDENILEQSLQSYTYDCLSAGIRLCEWRASLNVTTPTCQSNSHYVGCAPACPPTCGEVPDDNDDDCTLADYCACDDDFVLKDGVCIPRSTCGCNVNGVTWSYGTVFTTDDCNQTCTCYGNGQLQCEVTAGCLSTQRCAMVRGGNYSCVDKPKSKSMCKVTSGLRYRTFDGTSYHSVTTCAYTMVSSTVNDEFLKPFNVTVMQQRMDSDAPRSTITEVKISYDGGAHELTMKPGVIMKLDGMLVVAGTSHEGVSLTHVGEDVVAAFDFGLVVRWNGARVLRIDAWHQLSGKIGGLCGDFDTLPFNDFVLRNGSITDDVATFFNSWEVEGHGNTGCHERVKGPEPPPCPDSDALARARGHCNVIVDRFGPFKACHSLVDPQQAFKDCVFDSCVSGAETADENRVIVSYSMRCTDEGGNVTRWRTDVGREIDCPAHSTYKACMAQCQPSCSDRAARSCGAIDLLGQSCVEGCQCIDGYMKENGKCIEMKDCGCLSTDGLYIAANRSGFVESCSKMCQCTMGQLTCTDASCLGDQRCGVREDEYGCHWIDECEYFNGGCSHTCKAVNGTIECSCPPGQNMSADGKTCIKPQVKEEADCPDKDKQKTNLAELRKKSFQEWTQKLEKYMNVVENPTSQPDSALMCGSTWTQWLDRDDPGGTGDEETFALLRHEFPHLLCKNPVAIEARMANGSPATLSGNNVTMSVKKGLLCVNRLQPAGKRCADFQVRFLCLDTLF